MRDKEPITFGKGFNFDIPACELPPGFWSGGQNFRFNAGIDEQWDGMVQLYNSGSNVPLWGGTLATATGKFAVYLTSSKAFCFDSSATEITRKTDGKVITNMTAVGTTVTVTTAQAHGLTAGVSVVSVYGCVPTTYNATGTTVSSTPTSTTFTYTVLSAPSTSPATVFGGYHGSSTSNFNALAATVLRYTGGAFNGIFLLNHPQDGLFYWDGNTSNPLRRIPHFTSSTSYNTCVAARAFKNFIVILGKVVNEGTEWRRQNVSWSNAVSDPASLPTTFDASDTNLAGEVNLAETNGNAVDCCPLGDANIVYFSDARYSMRYLPGSTAVFSFQRLPGSEGLAYANCVVDTPVGHVFMTPDFDVCVHNGGAPKSIAIGRFKKYITDNINYSAAQCSFLASNPAKNEVWICFPTTASTVCDKAIAWNWVEDSIGFFDLTSGANPSSGVSFGVHGQWPYQGIATYENKDSLGLFAYHATDSTKTGLYTNSLPPVGKFFETPIVGTLIRTGIDMGDRDQMKTLHRSRWNWEGTAGDTVTIYHGSSKFADAAPTYTSGATYTVGTTDYVNARSTQGRFLAIKAVTATVATVLRNRSADWDIAPGGKR